MITDKKLLRHTQKLIATLGSKPIIVVGLSGGPDSVFLLFLLKQLQDSGMCTLVAAHLNHGWRAEAAQDAAWCKALCVKLTIPFVDDHAHNYPIEKKYAGSAEAIGRKKRQLFYATIKQQYQATAIALGHHRDDQLETFFIRLARGTSLSGLHGMDPYDGMYLRPLLDTNKQDIVNWLTTHKIDYLNDATNAHDTYLRNRIRHHLVPALTQCDTRFSRSITNTMARLKDEDAFLDELTREVFNKIFEQERAAAHAPLSAFITQPLPIQRRLIIHWLIIEKVDFTPSEGLIEEIVRFLHHPHGGSHQISATHRLVKQKSRIRLENTVG